MRRVVMLSALAVLGAMALSPAPALLAQEQQAPPAQAPPAEAPPAAAPAPSADVDVDIATTEQPSGWAVDPLWLVVGAVVLVLVIALIVAASRGGSTTIVND